MSRISDKKDMYVRLSNTMHELNLVHVACIRSEPVELPPDCLKAIMDARAALNKALTLIERVL